MVQLLGHSLLPFFVLLTVYGLLAALPLAVQERSRIWAQVQLQVIKLLMVATASALLAVGECDSDLNPPIMAFVPEVRCDSRMYYMAVLFALALGGGYLTYISVLLLESIAHFNNLASPIYGANSAEYAVAEGTMALEIKLLEEVKASESLRSAILDAHQVFCQQAIQRDYPQHDVTSQPELPDAKATRLIVINEELASKDKAGDPIA